MSKMLRHFIFYHIVLYFVIFYDCVLLYRVFFSFPRARQVYRIESQHLPAHTVTATVIRRTIKIYRDADKSLARPTSRYILFNGANISFDASLVIYT